MSVGATHAASAASEANATYRPLCDNDGSTLAPVFSLPAESTLTSLVLGPAAPATGAMTAMASGGQRRQAKPATTAPRGNMTMLDPRRLTERKSTSAAPVRLSSTQR